MSGEHIPGSGPKQERARAIHPSETRFNLEGEDFTFATYNIGEVKEHETPGLMNTGREAEVLKLHENNPLLVSKGTEYAAIPYTWFDTADGHVYGDYSTPEGQDELKDTDLAITTEGYEPPEWAADLQRFARLKQARRFTLDETLAAVRNVEAMGDHLRFTVGPSLYSQAFYSMGSEGVRIELSDDERRDLAAKVSPEHMNELNELLGKLQKEYVPGSSLREAIMQKEGGLPAYGDQVYSSLLGVAGVVLTSDGNLVFVRRGKNVSVNQGINVTASGGVSFDADALSRHGLPHHLGSEMQKETEEEIGLKSGVLLSGALQERIKLELGVEQDDYELVQVGFARELLRGGSPEAMFLIRYKGTTDDLVNTVANKKDVLSGEVDELMYAMPVARTAELIRKQAASTVIQHKGILNLIMIDMYLKQNG